MKYDGFYCAGTPRKTRSEAFGGRLKTVLAASLCALVMGGLATPVRADSSAIDFEFPPYNTGSINGQDGWSATGAYDYEVAATAGFGSPAGFALQSFRISNAMT